MSKEIEKNETEELYIIPNLVKAFEVLELLSESSEGMALQEIRAQLSLSVTTGYRILTTMVRQGYLDYNEASKRYKLSSKMLTIGLRSVQEHNLMDAVLPRMRKLRDEIGESVFFGVMSSNHILVLEQSIGTHAFCFFLSPGKQIELHCSAPGKAMMAYMPEDLRDKIIEQMNFKRYNENTIDNASDYLKELEQVRLTGYALDKEEEMSGVICISSPILDYGGTPCACLWTSGPKDRLTPQTVVEVGEKMKQVTDKLSEELGYTKL